MDYKLFRSQFSEAVKELEKEHNISLSIGSISYNSTKFTTRLTGSFEDDDAEESRKIQFEQTAKLLDIPADWYNKIIKEKSGEEFMIVDINTRARKNVLKIERVSDGAKYGAPISWVKGNLNNK